MVRNNQDGLEGFVLGWMLFNWIIYDQKLRVTDDIQLNKWLQTIQEDHKIPNRFWKALKRFPQSRWLDKRITEESLHK